MNIVTKFCEGQSKMRMQDLLQGCKPVKKSSKNPAPFYRTECCCKDRDGSRKSVCLMNA